MDDIQRVIDILSDTITEGFNVGDRIFLADHEQIIALTTVISAMQELQQYRQLGTVNDFKKCKNAIIAIENNELINIVDEYAEYRKLGTVEQVKNQKRNLCIAYNMLGKYQMIGTPEECWEAWRRQQAIRVEICRRESDGTEYVQPLTDGAGHPP